MPVFFEIGIGIILLGSWSKWLKGVWPQVWPYRIVSEGKTAVRLRKYLTGGSGVPATGGCGMWDTNATAWSWRTLFAEFAKYSVY